jgi:hypothetical protein
MIDLACRHRLTGSRTSQPVLTHVLGFATPGDVFNDQSRHFYRVCLAAPYDLPWHDHSPAPEQWRVMAFEQCAGRSLLPFISDPNSQSSRKTGLYRSTGATHLKRHVISVAALSLMKRGISCAASTISGFSDFRPHEIFKAKYKQSRSAGKSNPQDVPPGSIYSIFLPLHGSTLAALHT